MSLPRSSATPLDIDILADVVLPLSVDRVKEWATPGKAIEMLAEGVWLESPADMARAWPAVWETPRAAKEWGVRSQEHGTDLLYRSLSIEGWSRVRYQRAGAKQRWKEARFDPAVVPDPRGWLEARLAPLVGFEASAERRPIERVAIVLSIPGGRSATLEHFAVGGKVIAGRVAVVSPRGQANVQRVKHLTGGSDALALSA